MADDYDKKKLVKAFKKKFAPSCTVTERPECGEVIALRGDRRTNKRRFLLDIGRARMIRSGSRAFSAFGSLSLSEHFLATSKSSRLSLVTSLKSSQLV